MTTNFLLTDHTYHIFKEILIQTLTILIVLNFTFG